MALLVIWSHSFAIHLGSERNEWISLTLNGVYNAGNLGVMAFFVISGFLITQSYVRSRSRRSYFEKRVRRIYPGYMVATTISALVMAALLAPSSDPGAFAFVKSAMMNLLLRNYSAVADSFGNHDGGLLAVNGALWSIPYEVWCYVGVAVLGAFSLATNRRLLLFLLVSVMLLHLGLDLAGRKPGLGILGVIFGWPYQWTKMLPSFLLGMVAFAFQQSIPRSRWIFIGLIWAAIAGCRWSNYAGDLVVAPALAYAIFYIAFSERLSLHNAAKFGDFSYGTYLYGFLIQKILQLTVARNWSTAEFFIAAVALSLSAAFLSWHLVEKRFLARRPEPRRTQQYSPAPTLN